MITSWETTSPTSFSSRVDSYLALLAISPWASRGHILVTGSCTEVRLNACSLGTPKVFNTCSACLRDKSQMWYCQGSLQLFPSYPAFASHQHSSQFMPRLKLIKTLDHEIVWFDPGEADGKSLGCQSSQVFWLHLEITLKRRPFSCVQSLPAAQSRCSLSHRTKGSDWQIGPGGSSGQAREHPILA